MTPDDLHVLAFYHREAAEAAHACAKGMGDCPKAREIKARAVMHETWAKGLTDLADNFYAYRSSQ